MRSLEQIRVLAREVPFLSNPETTFLSEGFGNYSYLVREDGKKYVLRIKKNTEKQFLNSLEREYVFLRYFQTQNVFFCPAVYFYDKEHNFMVEGFLEGKEVEQKDFLDTHIDLFAQQLCMLYKLSTKNFSSFCSDHAYKEPTYVSPMESLETYGFKRFREAKENGLDEAVSGWIERQLHKNKQYVERLDADSGSVGFSWGDIQSRVILNAEGEMYFYDFEHATIANTIGLAYIKIHGSFNELQFNTLVDCCASYLGRGRNELLAEVFSEERMIRVNDVVWAAMMWASTDDTKFATLMRQRINLTESLC